MVSRFQLGSNLDFLGRLVIPFPHHHAGGGAVSYFTLPPPWPNRTWHLLARKRWITAGTKFFPSTTMPHYLDERRTKASEIQVQISLYNSFGSSNPARSKPHTQPSNASLLPCEMMRCAVHLIRRGYPKKANPFLASASPSGGGGTWENQKRKGINAHSVAIIDKSDPNSQSESSLLSGNWFRGTTWTFSPFQVQSSLRIPTDNFHFLIPGSAAASSAAGEIKEKETKSD